MWLQLTNYKQQNFSLKADSSSDSHEIPRLYETKVYYCTARHCTVLLQLNQRPHHARTLEIPYLLNTPYTPFTTR
jgi:hypothetical protein